MKENYGADKEEQFTSPVQQYLLSTSASKLYFANNISNKTYDLITVLLGWIKNLLMIYRLRRCFYLTTFN